MKEAATELTDKNDGKRRADKTLKASLLLVGFILLLSLLSTRGLSKPSLPLFVKTKFFGIKSEDKT